MRKYIPLISLFLILALCVPLLAACGQIGHTTAEGTEDTASVLEMSVAETTRNETTAKETTVKETTVKETTEDSPTAELSTATSDVSPDAPHPDAERLLGKWTATIDMRQSVIRLANDEPAYEALPEHKIMMFYTFGENNKMSTGFDSSEDTETFMARHREFTRKNAEITVTLRAAQSGKTVEEILAASGFEGTLDEYLDSVEARVTDIRGVSKEAGWRLSGNKIYMIEDEEADTFERMEEEDRERVYRWFVYEFDENGDLILTDTNAPNTLAVLPLRFVKE